MCAQLEWNLRGSGIPVVCWTCAPSDFDSWSPGVTTAAGRPVLFVSDERYPQRPGDVDGAAGPPHEQVAIERGGTAVRRFALTAYPPGRVVWPRRAACGGGPSASN